jgi:hypothetical protein
MEQLPGFRSVVIFVPILSEATSFFLLSVCKSLGFLIDNDLEWISWYYRFFSYSCHCKPACLGKTLPLAILYPERGSTNFIRFL